MSDDHDLLRRYAKDGDHTAFHQLVARYINLVYSAALRSTRNAHMAEDITQMTFTSLAKNASTLSDKVMLGGWLYRHACYLSNQSRRSERRRQARERRAMELNEQNRRPDAQWSDLEPLLEEAMSRLAAPERDAIILRFFQRHDLSQVGELLGVSEEAARKRVSRGIEKLRSYFSRRGAGATLSAAALASMLEASAHAAVPAALTAAVAANAITTAATCAVGAASGTSGLTLLKVLIMTKVKSSVAAAVLLAAGIAVPFGMYLAGSGSDATSGGVAVDPSSARGLTIAPSQSKPSARSATTRTVVVRPRSEWKFAGYATPEAAFETMLYAASQDDLDLYRKSLTDTQRARDEKNWARPDDEGFAKNVRITRMIDNLLFMGQQSDSDSTVILRIFLEGPTVRIDDTAVLVRVDGQWKFDGRQESGPRIGG